jgi:4a-hydroxytetrahydrobiopterin dehydratase
MTRSSSRPPAIGAAAAVDRLTGWRRVQSRDAIEKHYTFADFNAAFAFMTRVALYAERHDHHPEWSNVYNRVSVVLITHDADGVTERDVSMATFMDQVAASF